MGTYLVELQINGRTIKEFIVTAAGDVHAYEVGQAYINVTGLHGAQPFVTMLTIPAPEQYGD